MALAPIINVITPFQNAAYANQWTPDIYWRLVMYWHGGLFIPWVTVLAVLVATVFSLDEMPGIPGRLVKESIFIGGVFAVPVAGIAGIFDVYDNYAFGAPLWTQIAAFVIADEMAIALIVAMLNKPRISSGFRAAGMPYYTILLGVTSALVAAMMGHVGGWITWFGPNPAPLANYVNSTMYPVLGYYNQSAVIAFTQNSVGGHSHLMLVALMAGVVGLAGASFKYADWSKAQRTIAGIGFTVMAGALVTAIVVYIISGVGNYSPPSFFVSPDGVNGVAGDDLVTATVALGAAFVLAAFIMHSGKAKTWEGRPLRKDPVFLSTVVSWVLIYLVIPVTGFYINFNETFYKGAGLNFDAVFTRYHQDFGFFVLPLMVTVLLALNSSAGGSIRKRVGYLFLGGEILAFLFGETYALSVADPILLYGAVFGGLLIGSGAILAARSLMYPQPPAIPIAAAVSPLATSTN